MDNAVVRAYRCIGDKVASLKHPILTLIIIGLIVRMILSVSTIVYDVNYWGLVIRNIETGEGLYNVAGYYYTPVWGYLLGVFSAFSDAFLPISEMAVKMAEFAPIEISGSPFIFTTSMIPTLAFAYSVKIPLIILDIIFAYLVYVLAKEYGVKERNALMAFLLAFMAPTIMYTSGIVSMPDVIGATLTVLTIILLKRNHNLFAGMTFSLAILTKFFPAFMLFPLIAYVIAKNSDKGRNEAVKQISLAAIGFVLVAVVIFLPQLMDGNILDCFKFITDRAAGEGDSSFLGELARYSRIIIYAAIALVSLYFAYRMLKDKDDDLDDTMLRNCFIMAILCLVFPPSVQYVCIIIPFLAIWVAIRDERYVICWCLIAVGALIQSLMIDPSHLTPWATSGILDINVLKDMYDIYCNNWSAFSIMSMQFVLGSLLTWSGILLSLWYMYGEKIMEFIKERKESRIPESG